MEKKETMEAGHKNRQIQIKHPARLQITEGNRVYAGGDQNWYPTRRGQISGCGPTAAAGLLLYAQGGQDGHQAGSISRQAFLALMKTTWDYITPGVMGVFRLGQFKKGLIKYSRDFHAGLAVKNFGVSPFARLRQPLFQAMNFIKIALEGDSPVAFLNRGAKAVPGLDSWHWVLITGLLVEDRRVLVEILDGGFKKQVDFALWYRTTKLGGGLVAITLMQ